MQPHQKSILNKIGKALAPPISRLIRRKPLSSAVRMLETYLAFIQGKGAGTGWDIETEVFAAESLITEKEPIVFDVGANVGDWTEHLIRRLGPCCRVIQFEPAVGCIKVLKSKKTDQITIIEAAVGDKNGSAVLYSPSPTSSIGSLYRRRDSYFQGRDCSEQVVNVVTLDDIIAQCSFKKVDFVKLDLEGNEYSALCGAQKSLKDGIIRAISFEFGSGNINSRTYFHDFWDLLHPMGYTIFRICPGKGLLPIHDYYEDLEYFRGATNYLAKSNKL